MGAVRTHKKMSAMRPSASPSFVYRQDGYELSYEIMAIIAKKATSVKSVERVPEETFLPYRF